ncbi:hypothetical protein I4U23_016591 [Adineta vaga]|nr:hypothetical protein I4U23_016591 [Adineta vaga]
MAASQTIVRGYITRLCPLGDRLYFHVSGDQLPYGFNESDYNFILYTAPNFQSTYQLLLKAAEHKWNVVVQRSGSIEMHKRINQQCIHYNVDYVYVDF